MPQSINDIVTDLRARLRDTDSANYYWGNNASDGFAITSRINSNMLWLDKIAPAISTEEIAVTGNTYDYSFPTDAFEIVRIWLEDGNGRKTEINKYQLFNNRIYFTEIVPTSGTLEIWYTYKRSTVPLVATTLSGSITAAATGSVVCESMSAYPYSESGTVQIAYEQMTYTSVSDTGFWVTARGANSTTAAAQDDTASIKYVPDVNDEFLELLKFKTVVDLVDIVKNQRAKFEQWASQGQFDVNLPQLIALQASNQQELDKLIKTTGKATKVSNVG